MSAPSPIGRHGVRFGLPRGDEEFRRLSAALQVPQKVR